MDNFSSWQNPPINPWPEEQRAIGIGEANFLFNSLFLLLQMPWKLVDIIEQLLHTKTQLQLQFLYRRWWLYSNRLQMLKVSVQFSSTAQLCPNLWDPMNCSKPGRLPIPWTREGPHSAPRHPVVVFWCEQHPQRYLEDARRTECEVGKKRYFLCFRPLLAPQATYSTPHRFVLFLMNYLMSVLVWQLYGERTS